MGRHTADDGASAHPLIAAALEHRPPHGAHRHSSRAGMEQGGLGWPGPPPGEPGLGWPAADTADTAEAAAPAEKPAPVTRRRGWRRLFGARAA